MLREHNLKKTIDEHTIKTLTGKIRVIVKSQESIKPEVTKIAISYAAPLINDSLPFVNLDLTPHESEYLANKICAGVDFSAILLPITGDNANTYFSDEQ